MDKEILFIEEEHTATISRDVLRLRPENGTLLAGNTNSGSLCLRHQRHRDKVAHLDFSRTLIDHVKKLGGDFLNPLQSPPDGAVKVASGAGKDYQEPANYLYTGGSACWGGSIYTAWRAYKCPEDAIKYLNRYFDVRAATGNQIYTQTRLDQIVGNTTIPKKLHSTDDQPKPQSSTAIPNEEENGSQISKSGELSSRVTINTTTDGLGLGNITIKDSQVVINTGSPQIQSAEANPPKTGDLNRGNGLVSEKNTPSTKPLTPKQPTITKVPSYMPRRVDSYIPNK
jgi:hypothetical protein